MKQYYFLTLLLLFPLLSFRTTVDDSTILLKDATLIDGNGGTPSTHTDILVKNGVIAAVGKQLKAPGAAVISCSGKTIMPAIISAHVHIGMIGSEKNAPTYTRENILKQLKKYTDYGITNILVMGSDEPMLFNSGLRDSTTKDLLPGARIHSAGFGFSVPGGPPPMKYLFRPKSPGEAIANTDSVALMHPEVLKLWVDNFGGGSNKMSESIYQAIINQAHKHNIRVAAHLYYEADAQQLVKDGLDIIAHSIRDKEIDNTTVQELKKHHTIYIPTLALDQYAIAYTHSPSWINDPFFTRSLEAGVHEQLSSTRYQQEQLQSKALPRNEQAFQNATKNVKKLYDAGIIIALGTDSGANPVRAQGFSEHLEMQLLVAAGLTPLEAITVATKNAAKAIGISDRYGTIEKGKVADLLILHHNPAANIKHTQNIAAVYKAGVMVSKGPL